MFDGHHCVCHVNLELLVYRNRTWRNEQVFTIAPMERCIIGVLHESGHLNLGSFVKNMSWYANVIIIDGEKQAENEVETPVRWKDGSRPTYTNGDVNTTRYIASISPST